MRLIVIALAACVCITNIAIGAAAGGAIRRPIDIGPQNLECALQVLAKDSDMQMVYRSELVNGQRTTGASGILTFEEALTQILRGSGLVYRYLDRNAVTLVRERPAS